VRRDNVFEDSFRELHRRSPEEWKNRFYIVFEGEEGQVPRLSTAGLPDFRPIVYFGRPLE
jgi:hypothetical protein